MSVTSPSIVVGVFRDRSMAEQALEAFYSADFTQEQICYAVPASGSFFNDLRRLFKGADGQSGSLASDLIALGLSSEEAHYYIGEHLNGRTILAVQTLDRRPDALSILHLYGASIPFATPSPTPSPLPAPSQSPSPLVASYNSSVTCAISALPTEEPPAPLPATHTSFPLPGQPQPALIEYSTHQLNETAKERQETSTEAPASANKTAKEKPQMPTEVPDLSWDPPLQRATAGTISPSKFSPSDSDQPQPVLVEPAVRQPAPIMLASES